MKLSLTKEERMEGTLIKAIVNALIATVIGYLANNIGIGLLAYFMFVGFDRLNSGD